MNDQKARLRTQLRQRRAALSESERRSKSEAITRRCMRLLLHKKLQSVHCYQSVTAWQEVETGGLISAVQARGATVDIPSSTAVAAPPKTGGNDYDVIIVPMLGFDESRHRLGYGGGYYDRLLECYPKATTIGLCFELGHQERLPVEPHDKSLDIIVTEDRVYQA